MAKTQRHVTRPLRIYFDREGNTLTVWFDNPQKEYSSEETGREVILNRDRRGRVIGFEKLNFLPAPHSFARWLPVELLIPERV